VTLLGDAAHPMTPNLGQGACQAIEDAVVLACTLKEEGRQGQRSPVNRTR
jgi:2-polyprenyl-6-methoxyphenol hydroxylase-like FAD-dependent oxidoreductase